MINRTCLCGCGLSFKVLATNTKNYFFSLSHAIFAKNRPDEIGALAKAQVDANHNFRPNKAQRTARWRAYRGEYTPQDLAAELEREVDASN